MPRRINRRRFEAVTPTLAELQTKLESVRREIITRVAYLTAMPKFGCQTLTVRYLGIDVDDALGIAEQVDI